MRGTDEAGRDAPAGGPGVLELALAVLELDVEGLAEVLAEEVARAGLKGLLVLHHSLDAVGADGAGELLGLALHAREDGDGEEVLGEGAVDLEHALGLLDGLLLGLVGRVALLPEELGGAEEEASALLPAEDVGPLIDEEGQVAPGVDPVLVLGPDDGLARGADAVGLIELLAAAVGHDRELGGRSPRRALPLWRESSWG